MDQARERGIGTGKLRCVVQSPQRDEDTLLEGMTVLATSPEAQMLVVALVRKLHERRLGTHRWKVRVRSTPRARIVGLLMGALACGQVFIIFT